MLNFRTWLESPLANYNYKFNIATPSDHEDATGHFKVQDRIVITHPKTLATLERILSKHAWKFNILLYEMWHADNKKQNYIAKYDFLMTVENWMKQNNIPMDGHITLAINGSSGKQPLTSWMLLHKLGHALDGQIFGPTVNLTSDMWKINPKLDRTFVFKSMRDKTVSASELPYELFAEFLWNGKIRTNPVKDPTINQSIQSIVKQIEQLFINTLNQSTGKIIADYYVSKF